jgi:hypothetical protein
MCETWGSILCTTRKGKKERKKKAKCILLRKRQKEMIEKQRRHVKEAEIGLMGTQEKVCDWKRQGMNFPLELQAE